MFVWGVLGVPRHTVMSQNKKWFCILVFYFVSFLWFVLFKYSLVVSLKSQAFFLQFVCCIKIMSLMTEYSINIHLQKMKNKIQWVHTQTKCAVHTNSNISLFTHTQNLTELTALSGCTICRNSADKNFK